MERQYARGMRVIVRDFKGRELVRRVWEDTGLGIMITREQEYAEALHFGLEPMAVGFPKDSVVRVIPHEGSDGMDGMYQAICTIDGRELRSGLFTSQQEATTFVDQLGTFGLQISNPRVEPAQGLDTWSKADAAQRQAAGAGKG